MPRFRLFKVKPRLPLPQWLKDKLSRIPRGKKFWPFALKSALILVAVGLVSSAAIFAWYYKDLPRPGELRNRNSSESTILYDRNGKQIYDISGEERRILLKSDE